MGVVIEETVPAALAGERVDRAIALLAGCTRAEAAHLVAEGAVRVNRRVVRKGAERLGEDDLLLIDTAALQESVAPAADSSIVVEVRYEDADVLVVDKPAGLVVHPGAGTPSGTLVNGLLARYPDLAGVGDRDRPGVVHRLDKGTSGLLVVARTEMARSSLVAQLSERRVERRYLAVLCGHLEHDRGVIDANIGRDKRHPTRMAVVSDGRQARTHYEVLRRADEPLPATVVECRLETGRTHQIRVHVRAIGHPVLGDARYGGHRDALVLDRPALHAAALGFDHPRTGERVRVEAPPPADLAVVLEALH